MGLANHPSRTGRRHARMKQGITRRGGAKVTIDLLECRKEIAAGTFTEADRETLERILPGIYETLLFAAHRDRPPDSGDDHN